MKSLQICGICIPVDRLRAFARAGIFALTLACLLAAGSSPAGAQDARSVKVSVSEPLRGLLVSAGCIPVVVELENRGPVNHIVTVRAVSEYSSNGCETTRRIDLGPRERSVLEMPLPVTGPYYSRYVVTVSSDREGPLIDPFNVSPGGSGREPIPSLLVVAAKEPDLRGLAKLGASGGGPTPVPPRSIRPEDLPTNWISLTGVDGVVLDAPDLPRLDPRRLQALTGYLETGGLGIIVRADLLPPGELERCLPGMQLRAGEPVGSYGLGTICLHRGDPFGEQGSIWTGIFDRVRAVGTEAARTAGRLGVREDDDPPLIPGIGRVPVGVFAALVVLFAVAVGPVNFTVLSLLRRRALVVVTIPLLSLAALGLIVLYSVFGEGFAVKLVPRTMTCLDQVTHRAASIAKPGYYAGMSPRNGLRFGAGTAAVPARIGGRRTGGGNLTVDWSDGLRLGGGWVPARTPAEILLLQAGPCRQRIQFGKETPEGIPVTNGLEAGLLQLHFMTREGNCYAINNLAAGGTGVARLTAKAGAGSWNAQRSTGVTAAIRSAVPDRLAAWWPATPAAALPPMQPLTYVALVDRSIFAEFGVEGALLLPGMHLVRGRFGPDGE